MMIKHRNLWRGLAASLALALCVGTAARADVTWVLQPSTQLSLNGTLGTYTENQFYELYNAVPQTDNGTQVFNGFTNSLSTTMAGTLTSYSDATNGNNFLASLNFGTAGNADAITAANAQAVAQNSGLWLPNPATGTGVPGTYGSPAPANLAATLQASGLYPNEVPDGGKLSVTNVYGTYDSTGTTMPVDSTGHFSALPVETAGGLTLNLNYNTNYIQAALSYADSTTVQNDGTLNPAASFITRGTGANSYQYVMHVNIAAQISLIADPFYAIINVSENLVAAANLAKGDANFDGVVNGLDITAVAGHWLQSNPNHIGVGDVTGDGVVNGLDITMIAGNWLGHTPTLPASVLPPVSAGGGSGSSVPEPSTWVLMGLGSIGMWVLRRRAAR